MPKMDGVEVLERVKNKPEIPFIMISGAWLI